jgi:hypothetical protein
MRRTAGDNGVGMTGPGGRYGSKNRSSRTARASYAHAEVTGPNR